MSQIVASGKQAVSAKQAAGDDSPQQYLTFSLGGEVFALGILNVKLALPLASVTVLSGDTAMTPYGVIADLARDVLGLAEDAADGRIQDEAELAVGPLG